jgi:ParB family transcriptional regulator, chromosome partitioning protein
MAIKDAEHALNLEISENETRKDFSKAERIDYARRLERVESLKAKKNSLNNLKQNTDCENFHSREKHRTTDIVAEKLNIGSGKQYEREKFIVDNQSSLSPTDFSDWDEGKLSTNKAFTRIKQEKERLEKKVIELESRKPDIKIVEKERVVDNTDYSLKKKNDELSSRLSTMESEKQTLQLMNQTLKSSNETTKNLLEKYKTDSEEYRKFKSKMIDLGLEPDGNYNLANAATEIAKLTNEIEDMLTNKLAPIKYQNFMIAVQSNDVLKKNFSNTLHFVKDWYESMMSFAGIVNITEEIIDMEEN